MPKKWTIPDTSATFDRIFNRLYSVAQSYHDFDMDVHSNFVRWVHTVDYASYVSLNEMIRLAYHEWRAQRRRELSWEAYLVCFLVSSASEAFDNINSRMLAHAEDTRDCAASATEDDPYIDEARPLRLLDFVRQQITDSFIEFVHKTKNASEKGLVNQFPFLIDACQVVTLPEIPLLVEEVQGYTVGDMPSCTKSAEFMLNEKVKQSTLNVVHGIETQYEKLPIALREQLTLSSYKILCITHAIPEWSRIDWYQTLNKVMDFTNMIHPDETLTMDRLINHALCDYFNSLIFPLHMNPSEMAIRWYTHE